MGRIKFDTSGIPETPHFILAYKDGRIIGELTNISGVRIKACMKDTTEASFTVHMEDNGEVAPYWEEIVDYRLVLCAEWDTWFQARVNVSQSDETIKEVTLTKLGKAELSDIRIYDTEINTEDDISREDYTEPTVLHRPEKPDTSLLHRLMQDKAPHYSIRHVDSSIKDLQRTFTFNDKTLTECLDEIADEMDAVVVYDSDTKGTGAGLTVNREISIYDMLDHCNTCGHRGEFISGECTECGSTDISQGYGNDTSIIVDSDCLGNSMTVSTDSEAQGNCYRLMGGDDLMTAAIKSCNPNGSLYMWHITKDEKADMPEALKDRLDSYWTDYAYYQKEYSPPLPTESVSAYNAVVGKYSTYDQNRETVSSIIGYPSVIKAMWDAIDFKLFLEYNLMPDIVKKDTDAKQQASLLASSAFPPVAVTSIGSITLSAANSAILGYAKALADRRYGVKIKHSSLEGTAWSGCLTVTCHSDQDDTADTGTISVRITQDYGTYLRQRLRKRLENSSYTAGISALFDLPIASFREELKKYGLEQLSSFNDSCQGCLEILEEHGAGDEHSWAGKDPDMYTEAYLPYYNRLRAIQHEIAVREHEINTVDDMYNQLAIVRDGIQEAMGLESYLGADLWKTFSVYRRERAYSNDNFISDGLSNSELFQKAYEFIQSAEESITKSSSYRHRVDAGMKNLLAMPEFSQLTEYFMEGNWIRVKNNDGRIYKLRLLDYEIDFDNLDEIKVTFSDAERISDKYSQIKDTIIKTSSVINNYNATIQNTLNKYESLNSKVDASQTENGMNSNGTADSIGDKVGIGSIIGSINSSQEASLINASKIDVSSLFRRMFTVSDTDIHVGDELETDHIYIYYE